MTVVLKWISRAGDHGECWIILAVVLLFFRGTRWMGITILIALAVAASINNLGFKEWIDRAHPCQLSLPDFIHKYPKSFSFPSGHTTAAFTTFGVAWFMRAKFWGWVALATILMGLSRMALFVHYPTDILGGAIWGTLCGALVAWVVMTLKNRYSPLQDGITRN